MTHASSAGGIRSERPETTSTKKTTAETATALRFRFGACQASYACSDVRFERPEKMAPRSRPERNPGKAAAGIPGLPPDRQDKTSVQRLRHLPCRLRKRLRPIDSHNSMPHIPVSGGCLRQKRLHVAQTAAR